MRSSQRATSASPSDVRVTVPDACRDHVVPLTDHRASALTEAGIGLAGISELHAGFDWPGPNPRTHLVLATIAGHGHLTVGDEAYELAPGTVAIAPARTPRHHWADGPWTVVSIRIGDIAKWKAFHDTTPMIVRSDDVRRFSAPIEGILAELPAVVTAAVAADTELSPIDHLWARFGTRMNWNVGQIGQPVASDPFSMYASILRVQLESLLDVSRTAQDDIPARLAQLWESIRRDPSADWSNDALARKLHVSRATLHRIVDHHHSTSPGAIVDRVRMDQAANLLAHGDLPIGAIASRVGYSNPYSFSTAFRRNFGSPPSRFRAQIAALRTPSASDGGASRVTA